MKFFLNQSKIALKVFKVDKSFETKTTLSERTAAIGEAFGLGISETRRFQVFTNFEINIEPGEIVLITGDSGSGKSTLLHEIKAQMSGLVEFGGNIEQISVSGVDPEEVLIEGVGDNISEAISILSFAGLNEAFLMLRKFKELSDGQKYRYAIAKMLSKNESKTWIFDEFGAVLDRVTAKVVSYTVQKIARKTGRTLIVATTHEDLVQDLKPDIWVQKKFGDEIFVSHPSKEIEFEQTCSVLKDVKIVECESKELKELEKFHYRGSNAGIIKKCFKAVIGNEIVAGIMFVYPHMALRGRNAALPEFRGKVTSQKLRKINKEIVRISRVIVSPRFRSIGLGAYIVRETLPLAGTKYVEALAVMALYNPFFEHAGLKRVEVDSNKAFEKDIRDLESLGFRRALLASKHYTMEILEKLDPSKLDFVKKFTLKNCVCKKFKKMALIPRIEALDKEAIAEALQNVKSNALYLYWKNPKA